MSIATTLAVFALIIAAVASWQVYLAILTDRQNKVLRESFNTVMAWMEVQEKLNSEFLERMQTQSPLPDFEWEIPGDE